MSDRSFILLCFLFHPSDILQTNRSNQTMQRTATRCATTFSHDKTLSTSLCARSR
jgi:hypothetical protein